MATNISLCGESQAYDNTLPYPVPVSSSRFDGRVCLHRNSFSTGLLAFEPRVRARLRDLFFRSQLQRRGFSIS
jgi:hypothetical protein